MAFLVLFGQISLFDKLSIYFPITISCLHHTREKVWIAVKRWCWFPHPPSPPDSPPRHWSALVRVGSGMLRSDWSRPATSGPLIGAASGLLVSPDHRPAAIGQRWPPGGMVRPALQQLSPTQQILFILLSFTLLHPPSSFLLAIYKPTQTFWFTT